jgi:hypothetical protein
MKQLIKEDTKLDMEWCKLIIEALRIGISKEEIRKFLRE